MKILYLFFGLLFSTINLFSQTSTEVKTYYNRTNIAIYKCQKEILRQPELNVDAQFREAILLQLNAKAYFEKNDLVQALNYAVACRKKCIELFPKLNVQNYSYYLDTPEEQKITKDANAAIVVNKNEAISSEQVKAVSLLDIKSPQAIYSTLTNIN